jgi:hypothetical protein
MENNSKKSIDSLKGQEVDGTSVKGGFTLIKNEIDFGTYHVNDLAFAKQNVINHGKQQGFKWAVLVDKISGKTTKIDIP